MCKTENEVFLSRFMELRNIILVKQSIETNIIIRVI